DFWDKGGVAYYWRYSHVDNPQIPGRFCFSKNMYIIQIDVVAIIIDTHKSQSQILLLHIRGEVNSDFLPLQSARRDKKRCCSLGSCQFAAILLKENILGVIVEPTIC